MVRSYDLLIFDWDGTAVPDRNASGVEVREVLEHALQENIICIAVTGTNVEHLLRQGLDLVNTEAKRNLFLCTNRGSEVWGFDPKGSVQLIHRREATAEENRALDRAAIALEGAVDKFGINTQIVFKRLNRRKLDLLPEWPDPKKAEFEKLFEAVSARVAPAGGLAPLMEMARKIAVETGLSSPRLTSDIKHIEIGLTDKSDSVRWAYENIIVKRNISPERVAVLGDEFGSIGGIQGSDALLRLPELKNANYFSVGVEPEGVPVWAEHLGGGPERFCAFVREQTDIEKVKSLKSRLEWKIIQEGFEPSREREMEVVFAIGNGYLGVRAHSDFPVPAAEPDLLVAGIYDRKAAVLPYSEVEFIPSDDRTGLETEIVPFPSPFLFRLRIGDEWMASGHDIKLHARALNFHDGMCSEQSTIEDGAGNRLKIYSERCASLADPHLLFHNIRLVSENYSGPIAFDFRGSSTLEPFKAIYPHINLEEEQTGLRSFVTKGSHVECAIASRIFSAAAEDDSSVQLTVKPAGHIDIKRVISIFTSRDGPNPRETARNHLAEFSTDDYSSKLRAHKVASRKFWAKADIRFSQDPALAQAQRFNLYHLRSGANSDAKSIPAKALTGRAYEGHVFWDTEIFMFPFFLYTVPEIARSLLVYRYQTLPGAKQRAKELGLKGASYAWESSVSGLDVTPRSILVSGGKEAIPIFTGTEQVHVTADVAYAVWKYWDATLDESFLREYGAEILIETARFWSSRTSVKDDRYHILQVVGPDEYHYHVDDNTYTNWMARWNLQTAAWVCDYLRARSPESYSAVVFKTGLDESETAEFKRIADRLYLPEPDSRGVIEQHRGFHSLESISVPEQERYHAPVSRLFNWKKVNEMKLLKQADILMIPFLFPKALSSEIVAANYDYYEPLTDHGSSLSPCVYAALAAQSGRFGAARKYWERSLDLDLQNLMGNTGLGIHGAAIGGTWQALVFHILGIELTPEGPKVSRSDREIAECGFGRIDLQLTYRGKLYPLSIGHNWARSAV